MTDALQQHLDAVDPALGAGKAALGGLATTMGLERPGTIRALAGRPAPYFQQASPLSALLAVAQAQGRNLGY